MKRLFICLITCFPFCMSYLQAQKSYYPLSWDGDNAVVTGFESFEPLDDDLIFTNAYLWVLDNVCTVGKEGMTDIDTENKKFKFNVTLSSLESSKLSNHYNIEVSVKILSGKLVFYISDIWVEPQLGLMKKTTALSSLKPDVKAKDKEITDDFVRSESSLLNKMFSYININDTQKIVHWKEIASGDVVKGMNEDEVRLALGKPRAVTDSGKEVQWMYSSSLYVFFKNGKVDMIMR